jgi:hypothetical protein
MRVLGASSRLVVCDDSGKLDLMALCAMLNAVTCSRALEARASDGSSPKLADLIIPVMFRKGVDNEVVIHWFYFNTGDQ